jgi:ankyrin repeat protein
MLHLASEKGHLNVVQLLIEHNASVDQATKDGWTALLLALEQDHLYIALLLNQHMSRFDANLITPSLISVPKSLSAVDEITEAFIEGVNDSGWNSDIAKEDVEFTRISYMCNMNGWHMVTGYYT